MEACLKVFVIFEQNDWAKLLSIAKFAYNKAKNASTGHMLFELNCGYHLQMSYEEDVDPRSQSKSADKLSAELIKPQSYASGKKVWLNSKYIKIKRKRTLEAKFFGPFRVLYLVGKQEYKLELPKKWRIHDVFHISLLEQDTKRKERDNNAVELDAGENSGEFEVEAIRDSAVYAKESKSGHLPGLHYLISWKKYPEEKNTWKPASAVQHLRKLINSFHKNHPNKPTATSLAINITPPMARPTVKLTEPLKRKQERPTGHTRRAKRGDKKEATRRNPSQCNSKSQKPAGSWRSVSLTQGASESLNGSWPLAVWLLKNFIVPYSDQVPYHLSPSSLHHTWFFFPYP